MAPFSVEIYRRDGRKIPCGENYQGSGIVPFANPPGGLFHYIDDYLIRCINSHVL